ncbi:hypothetical protein QU487_06525 [Crenobacter sp. SG2305]|uniref:hypothetical protein n=1 Tax=Crenobacter oryzisoli TaxID=3056844 RepID=UPI0025AA36C6|nr:hypothetical protein [Crenobacter sp. SG2305]MDN0082408.1 hypothetical protein [Crenobacter sp. SG2305]
MADVHVISAMVTFTLSVTIVVVAAAWLGMRFSPKTATGWRALSVFVIGGAALKAIWMLCDDLPRPVVAATTDLTLLSVGLALYFITGLMLKKHKVSKQG